MPLVVEEKQLVTPGELLSDGDFVEGENTYKEGNRVFAARIGLVSTRGNRISLLALNGFYMPKMGDLVVGKVIDVELSGWNVDIAAPYNAMLFVSEALDRPFNPRRDELTKYFTTGDTIVTRVIAHDRTRDPVLTVKAPGLGKVSYGHVVTVSTTRIPRLIGAKGSMISLIKRETGCQITVGQNGRIIVSGRKPEDENLAIAVIRMVEREAQTQGLTDRIERFLKSEKMK